MVEVAFEVIAVSFMRCFTLLRFVQHDIKSENKIDLITQSNGDLSPITVQQNTGGKHEKSCNISFCTGDNLMLLERFRFDFRTIKLEN